MKKENKVANSIEEYIKSVSFRKQLFGIAEDELWTVVSNIQKYYEAKAENDAAVIENLSKLIAEKDELIAKQSMYIDAVRRKNDLKSEK